MDTIIKKLLDGNKLFQKKFFHDENALFESLVKEGQRPKVMIVACSDSRVDPAMIFNCMPGQLFVVRNVANLVPPCEGVDTYHGTSAALQFGVCFLEVEHVIVLGHSQCGGIRALVEGIDNQSANRPSGFITKWMEIASSVSAYIKDKYPHASLQQKIDLAERAALVHSLKNMYSFDWIKQRVEQGALQVHAWYFDLRSGCIDRYDAAGNAWVNHEAREHL